MKAIISTQYGSADVLKLADIEKPTPKDTEVLVKVRVATVTPSDSAFRQGKPFIIKLMYGLKKPRLQVPGVEFSGDIEAVGANVTQFKRGDAVYGISPNTFGAHAEYLTLTATGTIIQKSPNMTYEDATGIIDGATTALSFLKNVAKIQRGHTILINGASGAVGAYAVQLAKHFGAIVVGVCSTKNVELVKSLGANKVIDYTKEDFTQNRGQYDIIFDAVGKSTFGKCKHALKPKGIYMTTVPSLGIVGAILRTAIMGGKKAKFTTAGLKQSQTTLSELTSLFDAGAMRAVIDRCYPLEQVPDAHRYVDTGRKKGNVLITVS